MTSDRKGKISGAQRRILSLKNDLGEIGYAAGGEDADWPVMQELVDAGLIRFKEDRSYRALDTGIFKSREIYEITPAGRKALREEE
jgi:hypothetical protein